MRRIASDTGPVLHLYEARALTLLGAAGRTVVPPAVDRELTRLINDWHERRPAWLSVQHLTPLHDEQAAIWQQLNLLDPGEAEAISLAQQTTADWLLTDDGAARLLAQSMNLEVHGSLGLVLWAATVGHLDRSQAEFVLQRLTESSLWISSRVQAEARAALDQIFS